MLGLKPKTNAGIWGLRITKRSVFSRLKSERVFSGLSAILFLVGTAFMWYASVAEAGVTQWPNLSSSRQIATGENHTCAISFDGRLYCWGSNTNGQLGNGTNTQSNMPVAVNTSGVLAGKTIIAVTVGLDHTCAIASDNRPYCWGSGFDGQLGDYSMGGSNVPVAVTNAYGDLGAQSVKYISSGSYHTCVVGSDDLAYCWGLGFYGSLGDGGVDTYAYPVAVSTSGALLNKTIKSISAGGSSTCAIASDNNAYCWGGNSYGQLGDGSTSQRNSPVAVSASGVLSGKTIKSISAGGSSTCAIASDNNAYCWGLNSSGQLGNNQSTGVTPDFISMVPSSVSTGGVLSGKTVLSISTSSSHACAIASDNNAYCWGANNYGQLGDNSTNQGIVPVAVNASGVLSGKTIPSISAKGNHTCVVASDNNAYCWGANSYGQLGDNSTTQKLVPTAVKSNGPLAAADYRIYQNTDSLTPGAPLGLTNESAILPDTATDFRLRTGIQSSAQFKDIVGGQDYSCGLTSEGDVYCWGDNSTGKLGNGTNVASSVPVPIDTSGALAGKKVLAITGGQYHVCVIASDNNAYCWGSGGYGRTGIGTGSNSNIPVAVDTQGVLANKTIKAISAGAVHTCVIASDDQAYCWGYNLYGQLGNNQSTGYSPNYTSLVPSAVVNNGVLLNKTIKSISSGQHHTCVVASDNNAYCWGKNSSGELGNNQSSGTAPEFNSAVPVAVDTSGVLLNKTVLQIKAGGSHTCVVASDKRLYCWGNGSTGAVGNDSILNRLVPVAVLTNLGDMGDKDISSVSTGFYNTCAVASDGQAYCWGYNNFGQLGVNASISQSGVPRAVYMDGAFSGKTVLRIFSAWHHTCAIASDNQAYCWGRNQLNQLGNDTPSQSLVPVAVNTTGVLAGKTISSISSGSTHTCAIASDNNAYCWGSGTYGQLGNNSTAQRAVPVAVTNTGALSGKTILSISSNRYNTCAIASDNNAYCWGHNANGQVGNNSTTQSNVPAAVDTSAISGLNGKTVLSISVGQFHTCAIASDNQVYCWGLNSTGQLGNNSLTDSSVPVAVDTSAISGLNGKTVLSVSAGGFHTCVIASDNKAYCWGANNTGRLGNNSTVDRRVPVAVDTSAISGLNGKTVLSISAGGFHTCATASDNKAYCWGANANGQLGDSSITQRTTPVAVSTTGLLSSDTFLSISSGEYYTCAIASDNKAYCWGLNASGQLGDNSTAQSTFPKPVDSRNTLSGKTILGISSGYNHTCVVASDNQAYCWGLNSTGQLGTTDIANPDTIYSTPASVATAYVPGPRIYAGDNTFKLQFAQRTTAMCSLQTTGFTDVTASTVVAYNDNPSVANGATITYTANDPVPSVDAAPQTYQDVTGSFTNVTTIDPGKTGLWDFSLKLTDTTPNRSYCMRLVYSSGSALEGTMAYPEIMTSAPKLTLGFVDASGNALTDPNFSFSNRSITTMNSQTSTGTFGTSTAKLRIFNTQATNGWNVTLSPTDGPTATWNRTDSLAKYDFNDSGAGGADSAVDGDSLGGQLSINSSTGAVASACSLTGLSVGSNASFLEGTTNSITLFSASSASALNCFWDYTGATMTQTIPAAQPAGSYTIKMTATVVAL